MNNSIKDDGRGLTDEQIRQKLQRVIDLPPKLGDTMLDMGVNFVKVDFLVVNFPAGSKPAQMFIHDDIYSITNIKEARRISVKNNGGGRMLPAHRTL